MVERIPEPLLARLSDLVAAKLGLNFPRERWNDLEKSIKSITAELGFQNAANGIEWLLTSNLSQSQTECLASHLTVGETYFFREKQAFEFLEKRVVPEWMDRRRADKRIRIWSAGCCSGEEPYSLAIFLSRVIPDWQEWDITILATDINPRFLRKASKGIYTEWSFRGAPSWVKDSCFKTVDDGCYEILPKFRKLVTFGHLNLAECGYPSSLDAMDLIFCRNVLMYFAEAQARKVVNQFHRALVNRGWLVVSPTETSPVFCQSFARDHFDGFTFYRKSPPATAEAKPIHEQEVLPPQPSTSSTISPVEIELPPDRKSPQAPAPSAPVIPDETVQDQEADADHSEPGGDSHSEEQHALSRARALADEGQLGESLAWCDKAIAVKKINAESHFLRATILQELGKLDESISAFKRALYLDPDFVLVYFALGNLALRRGDAAEAARNFENALSLLNRLAPETVLPGSEGLATARLVEIIRATMRQQKTS